MIKEFEFGKKYYRSEGNSKLYSRKWLGG
jgi:hypothetical protein